MAAFSVKQRQLRPGPGPVRCSTCGRFLIM
ncbi:MAG: hypothetical protein KAX16_07330 [Actinomycetia bacterium]|nr:hypothetical protein [Actinomycetes bacterium]